MNNFVNKTNFQKEVINFVKTHCKYTLILNDEELVTDFNTDFDPPIDIVIPELKVAIICHDNWTNSIRYCYANKIEFWPFINLARVAHLNGKGYRVLNIYEFIWEHDYYDAYHNKPLKNFGGNLKTYYTIQEALKDVLEGTENLNFGNEAFDLDFGWYNCYVIPRKCSLEKPTMQLFSDNNAVPDCGILHFDNIQKSN